MTTIEFDRQLTGGLGDEVVAGLTDAERRAEGVKAVLLIHRAMRADLDVLAEAAPELDPSDHDAARRLQLALGEVLKAIHVHHDAEDTILFPEIRSRRPDLGPVFDRLAADHDALDGLIRTITQSLTVLSWPGGSGRVEAHGALVVTAVRLRDFLHAHLDVEETVILPAWSRDFSERERVAVEKRVVRHAPVRDVAFVLPWILAHASGAERREIRTGLPVLFRVLNRVVWQRRFAERRLAVL